MNFGTGRLVRFPQHERSDLDTGVAQLGDFRPNFWKRLVAYSFSSFINSL